MHVGVGGRVGTSFVLAGLRDRFPSWKVSLWRPGKDFDLVLWILDLYEPLSSEALHVRRLEVLHLDVTQILFFNFSELISQLEGLDLKDSDPSSIERTDPCDGTSCYMFSDRAEAVRCHLLGCRLERAERTPPRLICLRPKTFWAKSLFVPGMLAFSSDLKVDGWLVPSGEEGLDLEVCARLGPSCSVVPFSDSWHLKAIERGRPVETLFDRLVRSSPARGVDPVSLIQDLVARGEFQAVVYDLVGTELVEVRRVG